MTTWARAALAAAAAASGAAHACDDAPLFGGIPDGATATERALREARTQVAAYAAALDRYLACLEAELGAAGDAAPVEYKELMAERIIAAKDERRAVVGAFNAELEAFLAAVPGAVPPR